MLQKPDLQDELIVACLQDGYGLRVTQLRFLPLGADLDTAVYRASIDDDGAYFLKLRRGPFDEMTVAIPALLGNQGIREVIVPLSVTVVQSEPESFRTDENLHFTN
jgi:spectinomycin phosphotransferase